MTTESESQLVIDQISTGEIEIEGRLVDASNATLLGKIVDGPTVIYKPVAGERPLWDFPEGNLASREVAAYLLSERSGFNIVPPTVLREGPYGIGAVQVWIDIDEDIDVVEMVRQSHLGLRTMALFDAIVNNTDRKFGHILFQSSEQVFGCDHGVTFHQDDKLRTVIWNWAGQPLEPNEIERLIFIREHLSSWNLQELITEEEVSALLGRVERLLEVGSFPLPSDEWPAVPWPPY